MQPACALDFSEGRPCCRIGSLDGLVTLLCCATLLHALSPPASSLTRGQVGIAHTRWATHGPPSAVNSHPHVSDPSATFTVVHNGIITNYKMLKDFLVNHGEVFVSETDTEVR